jgi:hypothetical protein
MISDTASTPARVHGPRQAVIRLTRVIGLLAHGRTELRRELRHRVAHPAVRQTVAGADEDGGLGPGADQDVLGPRRAVDEVPLPQRPLLAFDQRRCLSGQQEEHLVQLVAVVERHVLAGREDVDAEAERGPAVVALERGEAPRPRRVEPPRVAGVQHEPAVVRGHTTVLGRFHCRLVWHGA